MGLVIKGANMKMTQKKRVILFSFIVMCIFLASAIAVSAAPSGAKYYVNGYVKDDYTGLPISGADVALYIDGSYISTTQTTPQGYFSGSAYRTEPPRYWKAIASKTGYLTQMKNVRANLDVPTSMGTIYLMPLLPLEEKIGVFFWASDCGTQDVINEYKGYLQAEGYTKFYDFKDTADFYSDFQQVALDEDSDDIIFFYFQGHGSNENSHSFTDLRGDSGDTIVSSGDFRSYCDTFLESSKVGLFVSSCYAGDWVDDMRDGGYLAISSTDEYHEAYGVPPNPDIGFPGEEQFANFFFNFVSTGYNAIGAFNEAILLMSTVYVQNPQICNDCSYNFFA